MIYLLFRMMAGIGNAVLAILDLICHPLERVRKLMRGPQ